MPYLTPTGSQPVTIPRRSKAATDTFKASRNPHHTTRPAHYLPSSLKPLTSTSSPSSGSGPSGVGSASGRRGSRSDTSSTPRPSSISASPAPAPPLEAQDDEGIDSITAHLSTTALGQPSVRPGEECDRRDSTPSLSSNTASASSVSVQSLGGSDNDGETTPATSAADSRANSDDVVMMAAISREDRSEAVRMYMQGLYAFHRRLYEEAKSDAAGAPRKGSFSQFGERQSGMAKLAAKKALASKLNS